MIKIDIVSSCKQANETIEMDSQPLCREGVVIGRSKACGIVLNDRSVSRNHARVEMAKETLLLIDLGSKGGTLFEGTAISPHAPHTVQLGGNYTIGPFTLTFTDTNAGNNLTDDDLTQLAGPMPVDYQPIAYVEENAWQTWHKGKIEVTCVHIIEETHDVKTFHFTAQSNTLFRYQPGQFATLHLDIDGKKVSRTYTISSTPSRPHTISHTIKRVPAADKHEPGLVSNWLHNSLNVGDSIEISGPFGTFSCHANPSNQLCFISGGSGITPMLSMTRWLCDTLAKVNIVFIHVAKTEADIIAHDELEKLSAQYSNLRLVFSLTRAQKSNHWSGHLGRLTTELLTLSVPDITSRRVFVCAPRPFMVAVKKLLQDIHVPMDRYHEESFGGPATGSADKEEPPDKKINQQFGIKAVLRDLSTKQQSEDTRNDVKEPDSSPLKAPSPSQVNIHFKKSGVTIKSAGESILEAAESAGLSLPFGCRQGQCGTCKTKKLSGNIQKDGYDDSILSEEDRDAGFILLCIGQANGDLEVDA